MTKWNLSDVPVSRTPIFRLHLLHKGQHWEPFPLGLQTAWCVAPSRLLYVITV